MIQNRWLPRRKAVVLGMMFLIAAAHIIGPGRTAQGATYVLYYSYFSDLALPFGFYFLLCMSEEQFAVLRPWWVKLAAVFAMAAFAETCQYFGVPVLGETFDSLDYLMYALGAGAAALIETQVFPRIFPFWRSELTQQN